MTHEEGRYQMNKNDYFGIFFDNFHGLFQEILMKLENEKKYRKKCKISILKQYIIKLIKK